LASRHIRINLRRVKLNSRTMGRLQAMEGFRKSNNPGGRETAVIGSTRRAVESVLAIYERKVPRLKTKTITGTLTEEGRTKIDSLERRGDQYPVDGGEKKERNRKEGTIRGDSPGVTNV